MVSEKGNVELVEGINITIKKYIENIPPMPEKGISEFEYYYGGLPQAILTHLKKEGYELIEKTCDFYLKGLCYNPKAEVSRCADPCPECDFYKEIIKIKED